MAVASASFKMLILSISSGFMYVNALPVPTLRPFSTPPNFLTGGRYHHPVEALTDKECHPLHKVEKFRW